jgi:hypothetical protein
LDWRPFWNLPRLPDYNAIRATTPKGGGLFPRIFIRWR